MLLGSILPPKTMKTWIKKYLKKLLQNWSLKWQSGMSWYIFLFVCVKWDSKVDRETEYQGNRTSYSSKVIYLYYPFELCSALQCNGIKSCPRSYERISKNQWWNCSLFASQNTESRCWIGYNVERMSLVSAELQYFCSPDITRIKAKTTIPTSEIRSHCLIPLLKIQNTTVIRTHLSRNHGELPMIIFQSQWLVYSQR